MANFVQSSAIYSILNLQAINFDISHFMSRLHEMNLYLLILTLVGYFFNSCGTRLSRFRVILNVCKRCESNQVTISIGSVLIHAYNELFAHFMSENKEITCFSQFSRFADQKKPCLCILFYEA